MGILHAAMSSSLEGNRVAAISDKDSFLLKLAKKVLPTLNLYSDYRDMLRREDLDALFICTPVQTHYPISHDVLTNFKDINLFVEKPLASNYEEAAKMVEDSRKTSVITMVGYQKRFEGVFQKAKELLEADILGEVGYFRAHFFGSSVLSEEQGWKFRKGTGGATLEYGVHLLDLLIWYFGEPVSAKSTSTSVFSSGVDDFISSSVEFASGVKGSIEVGWSMRNYSVPELLIEVHGRNGYLSVTEDRVLVFLDRAENDSVLGRGIHTFFGSTLDKSVPFLIASPENVLQEKLFLDCVNNGTRAKQDFESAARVNRFVDLILSG